MHHIMFTLISHGNLQLSHNVFSSSWDYAISMANRSSLLDNKVNWLHIILTSIMLHYD